MIGVEVQFHIGANNQLQRVTTQSDIHVDGEKKTSANLDDAQTLMACRDRTVIDELIISESGIMQNQHAAMNNKAVGLFISSLEKSIP